MVDLKNKFINEQVIFNNTLSTHFESTVNTAIHTYSDCQKKNGQNTVATRIRDKEKTDRRAKLTNGIENLSSCSNAKFVCGYEPIGDHRK
jgi:hypothetical protein